MDEQFGKEEHEKSVYIREAVLGEKIFFRALPELPLPLPPIWANSTTFLDVKNNVLMLITEPMMITTMVGGIFEIMILLLLMILVLKMT